MQRLMTRRIRKSLLVILGFLLVVVLVGPFLVPVPALEGQAPQELADTDSHFIDIGDVTVHYKQYGHGEPTFFLLHGTLMGYGRDEWQLKIESPSTFTGA